MPKLPSGPRVSEPTTGVPVRTTSARLSGSTTGGAGAPNARAVLNSGLPSGAANRIARHSGRAARTRRAQRCAAARSTSVGADRLGERERLQRRDRQPQLGVDRGRERARQVERRLLGLPPLLLEQRLQRDPRHQRERQDRHRGEKQEPAGQRDGLHRAPVSERPRPEDQPRPRRKPASSSSIRLRRSPCAEHPARVLGRQPADRRRGLRARRRRARPRRADVVGELLGPLGADDHARHRRLVQQPGERDLRHRDAARLGDRRASRRCSRRRAPGRPAGSRSAVRRRPRSPAGRGRTCRSAGRRRAGSRPSGRGPRSAASARARARGRGRRSCSRPAGSRSAPRPSRSEMPSAFTICHAAQFETPT